MAPLNQINSTIRIIKYDNKIMFMIVKIQVHGNQKGHDMIFVHYVDITKDLTLASKYKPDLHLTATFQGCDPKQN